MLRARRTNLGCCLLLLFAAPILPSFGRVIHIDGSAHFQLILCHCDALICSRYVSGDPVHHLFALDPRTGVALWRSMDSNRTWAAMADGRAVYHETGGTLFKRNLTNGVILWQTSLDSLPEQMPSFSFLDLAERSYAKFVLGRSIPTPTRLHYQAPILTGGKLLMVRSAWAGDGCVISRCFDDWRALDPATGRVLGGGAGQFKGQVGSAAVFQVRQRAAFAVQHGKQSNLHPFVVTSGEHLDAAQLVTYYRPPTSHNSRQLFVDRDSSVLMFDEDRATSHVFLPQPFAHAKATGDCRRTGLCILPRRTTRLTTRRVSRAGLSGSTFKGNSSPAWTCRHR